MKILITTAIYPNFQHPVFGASIYAQIQSLIKASKGRHEIEVLVYRGHRRKLVYLKAPFLLRQRIASDDVDLIHAYYGWAGIVAHTQRKVPVVVTYMGSDLLGGIGEDGRATWLDKMEARASLALAHTADGVIVMSKQMAERVGRRRVSIIPDGLDLGVFHPRERDRARIELGLDPRKRYLLFAAHPDRPVKRFPFAASVARRLQDQDSSVELLVVHNESHPRLALYMNAADALVFPSYQEGSPNIVKQAMACNLPIVSTDVGDVREIVDGTDGCYVHDADPEVFTESLRQILQSRVRTNGFQNIRHLDEQLVAEQVFNVYDEVAKKSSRKHASQSLD